MILCVYCSERATVAIRARGWKRFACAKHDAVIYEQAQKLVPRRNFVRVSNPAGFHNDGRTVGVRVYRAVASEDVKRPHKRRSDGPFSVAAREASKRRHANRALAREAQAKFDALVKSRGIITTAKLLNAAPSTIEKFRYGGAGKPDTAARIEQALQVQP